MICGLLYVATKIFDDSKKMDDKINLVYLLGAGRSGTTLLATLLNSHKDIETLGEMHQFIEHLDEGKNCSCGQKLRSCPKWDLPSKLAEDCLKSKRSYCEKKEGHTNIPSLLLKGKEDKTYNAIQEHVFSTIKDVRPSKWYVDSSKYIARYLRLQQCSHLNLKGIYLIRDTRGVVYSFRKKVQTTKSPLSTLIYYNIINFFAELVYRNNKKDILKIRYEDLVEYPEATLSKIHAHILDEEARIGNLPEYFEVPHIVGGNRLKQNDRIRIDKDNKWKTRTSTFMKTFLFLLSFPYMLINNYKLK